MRVYTASMIKFVVAFLGLLGGLSLASVGSYLAPVSPHSEPFPVSIWTHEIVTSGGLLNDIELDAFDNPHVVFVETARDMLRYGHRQGDVWSVMDLAPFPDAVPESELAFDMAIDPAGGTPVVAYVNSEEDKLYLGRFLPSGWQWEMLGDKGGRLLSLRIDSAGRTHLVYVSGQIIHYLTRATGAWDEEMIGEPDNYIWNLSLALDAANRPHIATTGAHGSFYAERIGPNDWETALLPVSDLDNIEGLAVDSDGRPHFLVTESEIVFGRPPFARVRLSLVERVGNEWRFVPLWQDYDWYIYSRLLADDDGTLHVLFYDTDARAHYVTQQPGGQLYRDRPFSVIEGQVSLALDSDGRPHMLHASGPSLIYSRQGFEMHDELIYGALALN